MNVCVALNNNISHDCCSTSKQKIIQRPQQTTVAEVCNEWDISKTTWHQTMQKVIKLSVTRVIKLTKVMLKLFNNVFHLKQASNDGHQ
jgi:hypothetical protein